jgi:drug/metabolite transporter (DMT)-like permease
MGRDRSLLAGTASALAAAALFGMLGPLSRFAADAGVDGVAFTAWRAVLGVAFLAALIGARGGGRGSIASVTALGGRGRAALALAALMGLILNAAIFSAFGRIPIALVLMLFYTYPAGVTVIDVLLGHERFTAPRLVALALSTGGVIFVLAGSLDSSAGLTVDAVGIGLGLLAAACQVVFVAVSRTGYRAVPADAATLLLLVVAALGGAALAVAVGQGDGLGVPFRRPEAWPALLAGGILAGGVASSLFLGAIRFIGGTRTGILMLFEPVVGVTLAAVWLGESLVPIQLLGGALVLAGAAVLQLGSAPDHEKVVEAGAGPAV